MYRIGVFNILSTLEYNFYTKRLKRTRPQKNIWNDMKIANIFQKAM